MVSHCNSIHWYSWWICIRSDRHFRLGRKSYNNLGSRSEKIALKQFDGKISDFEFDGDDAVPHYEVEIKNDTEKVEIKVNAQDGTATITERKALKAAKTTNSSSTTKAQNAKLLTEAEAIAIAQAKASGTVVKAELDTEDGVQIYEIEIRNGQKEYDFDIDAITGAILSYEEDTDDDND